jgi:hypothetical protein
MNAEVVIVKPLRLSLRIQKAYESHVRALASGSRSRARIYNDTLRDLIDVVVTRQLKNSHEHFNDDVC